MIDDAELAAAIEGRPHWQADEKGALYRPPTAAAHVRIRPVRTPARAAQRYIAAIVEDDTAVYTTPWPTATSAVQWVERARLT